MRKFLVGIDLKITSSDCLGNKSQENRKGFLDSNFSGMKSVACPFILRNFLLAVPLIAQGVYTEADYNAHILFSVVSCPFMLYAFEATIAGNFLYVDC